MSTQFNSIWPMDRILSGDTTPGQSGPGSNGKEEVLYMLQSLCITRLSPSGCLVSYAGHSLWGVGGLHSAEMLAGVFEKISNIDAMRRYLLLFKA